MSLENCLRLTFASLGQSSVIRHCAALKNFRADAKRSGTYPVVGVMQVSLKLILNEQHFNKQKELEVCLLGF